MKTSVFKIIAFLIFLFFSFTSLIYGQNAQTPSGPGIENLLTPQQWEEDIDFLVKRLEIVHPDLYANVSKEKFDKRVNELRLKARTDSDVNIFFGIMEIVKLVKDGHTWVSWGNGKIKRLLHLPPFSVFMFSDGLFITSAIHKYSSIVGKKIVKVGDVSTEEFMERRLKIQPGENKWGELTSVDFYIEELRYLEILGPVDNLKLTLEDGTGTRSEVEIEPVTVKEYFPTITKKILPLKDGLNTTINGNSPNPLPLWLSRLDSSGFTGDQYWFTYLPEQEALYVQINECVNKDNDPFDMFYQRLFKTLDENNAIRLIIDVRNNRGGDHYEQPLLLGIMERPNLNKADKLFIITSRFTFSAGQHLVNQLNKYTNITSFGEPTAAKPNFFGGRQGFFLPNSGMFAAVSAKLWQDAGPNDFRILTEPDFYVPLTSTDYRGNHDPVLEQIFNYDSYKNLRPAFSDKMIMAYKEGGIEKLKRDLADIRPSYTKYGFNMENLLYDDLGSWISQNAKNDEDRIGFLRLLRRELPNSIPVCWDLAGWLDKPENKEEKISLYKKCLEINPAHRLAKMRLDLLDLEAAESKPNK